MTVSRSQSQGARTLAEMLAEVRSLGLPRMLELVGKVAELVGALHAAGAIQRAVSLDAIRLDDNFQPLLSATPAGSPARDGATSRSAASFTSSDCTR